MGILREKTVRNCLRECGCFDHRFLIRVVKAKDINLKFSVIVQVNALSHIKMDASGNFEASYHIEWLKKVSSVET